MRRNYLCYEFFQARGYKFEWPELTQGKKTEMDKATEQYKENIDEIKRINYEQWDRSDIPPWFR